MVNQATAAIIWQPQTKLTYLSFTAPDDYINNSTSTDRESLLSRPVKIEQDPAPGWQDSQFGNLETTPASSQNCQLIVDLFLVDDKAMKKDIIKMLSKH